MSYLLTIIYGLLDWLANTKPKLGFYQPKTDLTKHKLVAPISSSEILACLTGTRERLFNSSPQVIPLSYAL
jgi:hypothetical protein